jgi:hypothetical protein
MLMIFININRLNINKFKIFEKLTYLFRKSSFFFIIIEKSCVILTTQNIQPVNTPLTIHTVRDRIKN